MCCFLKGISTPLWECKDIEYTYTSPNSPFKKPQTPQTPKTCKTTPNKKKYSAKTKGKSYLWHQLISMNLQDSVKSVDLSSFKSPCFFSLSGNFWSTIGKRNLLLLVLSSKLSHSSTNPECVVWIGQHSACTVRSSGQTCQVLLWSVTFPAVVIVLCSFMYNSPGYLWTLAWQKYFPLWVESDELLFHSNILLISPLGINWIKYL